MKSLIVLLVLCVITTARAELSTEQRAKCEAEGGCLTMTRAQLAKAMFDAHTEGEVTGRHAVKVACWRDA